MVPDFATRVRCGRLPTGAAPAGARRRRGFESFSSAVRRGQGAGAALRGVAAESLAGANEGHESGISSGGHNGPGPYRVAVERSASRFDRVASRQGLAGSSGGGRDVGASRPAGEGRRVRLDYVAARRFRRRSGRRRQGLGSNRPGRRGRRAGPHGIVARQLRRRSLDRRRGIGRHRPGRQRRRAFDRSIDSSKGRMGHPLDRGRPGPGKDQSERRSGPHRPASGRRQRHPLGCRRDLGRTRPRGPRRRARAEAAVRALERIQP